MSEDLELLRERIQFLASGEHGPIVPVLGAGMSAAVVPGTAEMTNQFFAGLSSATQERLNKEWATPRSTGEKYMRAAELLSRTRNDAELSSIIRRAVLRTCTSPNVDPQSLNRLQLDSLIEAGTWRVGAAHRAFAEFYARLPAHARGPIITTNFDPLIEAALFNAGLQAHGYSIPIDNPPTQADLARSTEVAVLHIHGDIVDYGLSSVEHIEAARPALQMVLEAIISNANLLVLGYGGWGDALMQLIERRHTLRQYQTSALSTDITWCAHEADKQRTLEHPVLAKLNSAPGFALFNDIDAVQVFDGLSATQGRAHSGTLPTGWTALPLVNPEARPLSAFSEGYAPTWSDALPGQWPVLDATKELQSALLASLSSNSSSGVAAIGPLGEGKSLAIRQVAVAVAEERDDWLVLWREAGAPPLTAAWLTSASRSALGKVLFVIDDAELAEADLELLASTPAPGQPCARVLLACHDRLFWSLRGPARADYSTVVFSGFTQADAAQIARRWIDLDLVEPTDPRGESRDLAQELLDHGTSTHDDKRRTLFGAVLEVREPFTLPGRVSDLMDKLFRLNLRSGSSKLTLGHIFGAICLLETQLSSSSQRGGATRAFVASLANATGPIEQGAILRSLGKEAAITFFGEQVYSRHRKIAELAVEWLTLHGHLMPLAQLIGKVGGAMRQNDYYNRADFYPAYRLASSLKSGPVAIAAAEGAITGASNLLEPRITLGSIRRKTDKEGAARYVRAISQHLAEFTDRDTAVRALLVELAQMDLGENLYRRALGIAGLAMHDATGRIIAADQVEYCLSTLARSYKVLVSQDPKSFTLGAQLCLQAAERVMPDDLFRRHVRTPLLGSVPPYPQKLSTPSLFGRLAAQISPHSARAVEELNLPFTRERLQPGKYAFSGHLSFSNVGLFDAS